MKSNTWQKLVFFSLFGGAALGAPTKVGSLSPQVSDLVLDLGKKSSLIATVQRFSGTPHEAVSLGSFLHPNLEKIFALRPDWILTDDSITMPAGRARWEADGTKTAVLPLRKVRDLGTAADFLLKDVFADPRRIMPAVEKCLAKVPPISSSGTTLIFVSVGPPILAGHASFLSSLADVAGYRNLAGEAWVAAYPLVTEEWLITHRPGRVFYLDYGFGEEKLFKDKAQQWWPDTPPVSSLPSEPFAKASLQTLVQWERWLRPTPQECREIL